MIHDHDYSCLITKLKYFSSAGPNYYHYCGWRRQNLPTPPSHDFIIHFENKFLHTCIPLIVYRQKLILSLTNRDGLASEFNI